MNIIAIWKIIFHSERTNQVEVDAIFHRFVATNWLIEEKLFFNVSKSVSKSKLSIYGNMYFKNVQSNQSQFIHHVLYALSKNSILLFKKSINKYVCFIKIGIIEKKLIKRKNIKNKYIIKIHIKSGIFLLFILFRNGLNKTSKNDEKKSIFIILNCKYKNQIIKSIKIIIIILKINFKYSSLLFLIIFLNIGIV